MLFGYVTTDQNKDPSIRTLNILKLLYTGCSGKDAEDIEFQKK